MKGLILRGIYQDTMSARREGNLLHRDGLADAIAHANRENADLVVVRFDRLSRNTEDVSSLLGALQSCVFSIEEDMRLSSSRSSGALMKAIAEAEAVADQISADTKAALSGLKAAGKPLGMPGDKRDAAQASVRVRRENAVTAVERIADLLEDGLASSNMTAGELVEALNSRKIRTGAGRKWTVPALRRPLRDAKKLLQERAELAALPEGYLFDTAETVAVTASSGHTGRERAATLSGASVTEAPSEHASEDRDDSANGILSSLKRHPNSGMF